MHLKKIEMCGFKSFSKKTNFVFEPGVTAIVGPNGCGKTNVVDAIRWVLGEQSAYALRSTHMGDVIFNGTDNHKPLGMAEVSLILDNEDNSLPIEYSEIMVTRRLFRSGESQYFINKSPCRLRDINELFMDTGIGTSAYSLLEQGKVDLILSSKPEDRRFLFEEAAGITKYKNRRKEALRKLESTEQNLLRVSDIIAEVKRRIGSLQRQVGKAKRYQKLSEQLKELEISFALSEYKVLAENRGKFETELNEMRSKVSGLSAGVRESELLEADVREFLTRAEEESNEIWEGIRGAGENIIQSENGIILYRDRIESLNLRRKNAAEEIEILENKSTSVLDELSVIEKGKEDTCKKRVSEDEKFTQSEKRLEEIAAEVKLKEKEVAIVKEEIVGFASLEAKRKSQIASFEAVDKSYDVRESRLNSEKLKDSGKKTECEKELGRITADWEGKRTEISKKEESLGQAETGISGLKVSIEKLRENIFSWKNDLNSMKSSLKLLEEMKSNYEGYKRGVKTVMSNKSFLPGICGIAADLVSVPGNLEAAVESALGEKSQFVVVEKREQIKEIVSFLKKGGGGRATFLAIDAGSRAFKEEASGIMSHSGVIGIASSKINVKPKYVNVCELLLGRTIIVDKFETALSIFEKMPPGWKAVTLEGEIVNTSGFITGGSVLARRTGLIGRNERIRKAKEAVEKLMSEMEGMVREESKLSAELERAAREEGVLRNEFNADREKFAGMENGRIRMHDELERLEKNISLIGDEISSVRKDRERLKGEFQEISAELDAVMGKKENCSSRMHSIRQNIEALTGERDGILKELTETRILLASLKEKEESLKEAFSLRERARAEYEEEIVKRKKETCTAEEEVNEFEKKIVKLEDDLKGFAEGRKQFEEKKLKAEEKKKEMAGRIEEMESSLRANRNVLRTEEEKMHQVDVRLTQARMQTDSLIEKISSRYRIDIVQAAKEREEKEVDTQIMSEEIVRLRTKFEGMGPVNLVAIEEHKELEERYNFLSEQHDDLSSARESLKKAIARINQTTRSMFMETFRKINQHFGEIFQNLFEGGRAELVLVDEKNVLETGIEIIARPPGKKLQSISLLSGGERAMTAIALLFALMKVKPCPFCVLDEIDAPLDESNIGRFTRLIRESSGGLQFIIVTHNKVTIAISDIVHGVTMEERGVSKQVSVRFSEKESGVSVASEV